MLKITKQIHIDELGNEIAGISPKLEYAASVVLELKQLLETAKLLCPVETGVLQDSIRVERLGNTSLLVAGGEGYLNPKTGLTVDYAVDVHDGTSRRPPNPFLLQALHIEKFGLLQELMLRSMEAL